MGVWACGGVQAKQKNVALLQLRLSPREDNDGSMFQYMVRPLPLTCVRPFYLQDNIALGAVEHLDRDDADARGAASEYLHELVRCSVHVCVCVRLLMCCCVVGRWRNWLRKPLLMPPSPLIGPRC